jgi:nickel transport protein
MKHCVFLAPGIALLFPAMLAAHGVESSVAAGAAGFGTGTVRFMYSTGEEMAFALVRVYAPSRPDTEIVQSITDRNGYYSFIPDEEGEWRITAEDDAGHKGEIKVTVTASGGCAAAVTGGIGGTPLALRVILGLSLIVNIFAVYSFILGRGPKAAVPEAWFKKGGGHAY